jgi:hypothetical protein
MQDNCGGLEYQEMRSICTHDTLCFLLQVTEECNVSLHQQAQPSKSPSIRIRPFLYERILQVLSPALNI